VCTKKLHGREGQNSQPKEQFWRDRSPHISFDRVRGRVRVTPV